MQFSMKFAVLAFLAQVVVISASPIADDGQFDDSLVARAPTKRSVASYLLRYYVDRCTYQNTACLSSKKTVKTSVPRFFHSGAQLGSGVFKTVLGHTTLPHLRPRLDPDLDPCLSRRSRKREL
ncbi:hypothetical protein ONZ45_g6333 [Pleurotus djamor]|nr:hypothetical protein ONZ45_g6333 [Pleurotus djamor]